MLIFRHELRKRGLTASKIVICFSFSRRFLGLAHLFTPSLRPPGQVAGSASFNFTVAHHDIYSAYLLVCKEGSFVAEVESLFINLDPEGNLSQHLAIEYAMMPSIYAVSESPY